MQKIFQVRIDPDNVKALKEYRGRLSARLSLTQAANAVIRTALKVPPRSNKDLKELLPS